MARRHQSCLEFIVLVIFCFVFDNRVVRLKHVLATIYLRKLYGVYGMESAGVPTEGASIDKEHFTGRDVLSIRRCVRIPPERKPTFPTILIGMGTYLSGLGFLWISGSILFSGFFAILGTCLIVVGMYAKEKTKNGRFGG